MSDSDDLRTRFAAGEGEEGPPPPQRPQELPRPEDDIPGANTDTDDTRTSPGSETETIEKQADPMPDRVAADVDESQVRAVPGTGGPDDAGDVDVDPDELNLPGRS
jgi:hypothetical protein